MNEAYQKGRCDMCRNTVMAIQLFKWDAKTLKWGTKYNKWWLCEGCYMELWNEFLKSRNYYSGMSWKEVWKIG